jgi:hypothetical protein
MEAMLGISLYSYLSQTRKIKKRYVFLIISYVFSSTKSKKGAEQVLPGSWERGLVGGELVGRRWHKQCIHM